MRIGPAGAPQLLGGGDGAGVAVVVTPPAPPGARVVGRVALGGALLLGRGHADAGSHEPGCEQNHGGREYRQLQIETSSRARLPRLQPPRGPDR